MGLIDELKEKIMKYIEEDMLLENINNFDDYIKEEKYLKGLKEKFTELNDPLNFTELLELYKKEKEISKESTKEKENQLAVISDVETTKNKQKKSDTSTVSKEVEVVQIGGDETKNSNKMVTQSRESMVNFNRPTVINYREAPMGILSDEIVKKIEERVDTIITAEHVSMITHNDGKPSEPYLNINFGWDVMNISAGILTWDFKTFFVSVPNIKDVLVTCTCTIFDTFTGNRLIDGIIGTKYIYKVRPVKTKESEEEFEEASWNEKSPVEICQSKAVRRMVNCIIPPYKMEKYLELALKKYREQKGKKEKDISSKVRR